ncbi:MAG: hypothetical protein ACPGGB_00835 [Flavobacteriales bacterium]
MNDSNDKFRNLLYLVRSHSFSLILLAAGLAWTTMYIRSVMASTDTADLSQPTDMLFAGLALIISAIVAMPAFPKRRSAVSWPWASSVRAISSWPPPTASSMRSSSRPTGPGSTP